jgi:hypothetical protein
MIDAGVVVVLAAAVAVDFDELAPAVPADVLADEPLLDDPPDDALPTRIGCAVPYVSVPPTAVVAIRS